MKNVKINRVGNTRFVNIPGVGVGMYSGMVGTFSAGNLSKTWEVEPEIVSGKEVVPYGVDNNLPSFVRDMLVSCQAHELYREFKVAPRIVSYFLFMYTIRP